MVLCGTAAFASLGLLMAGVLRAEATLAAANLLYLLLLVGGAIMTPVDEYPEGMQGVVRLLPSAALANGLRELHRRGRHPRGPPHCRWRCGRRCSGTWCPGPSAGTESAFSRVCR